MIRLPQKDDLDKIIEIHQKFYKNEFDLDDFLRKAHSSVIVELNGEIINVAAVKPILEVVTMTNKDIDVKLRKESLENVFQWAILTGGRLQYNQLHVFIQDQAWERHLIKAGFRPTVGRSLVIDI
jgi:hypothetical protein